MKAAKCIICRQEYGGGDRAANVGQKRTIRTRGEHHPNAFRVQITGLLKI